jgi:radical SAM superfamily enzyme YgiQ (UPF0313 family)
MREPRRIWWARPRKLCALERPGGGGRSHRPERRAQEIAYLIDEGVRMVISTMTTRHNLADYERTGLDWHHVPVADTGAGADALEELLPLLKRELRSRGAVAIHGNRHTDFVAAVCAAHLHEAKGADPLEGLRAAAEAGLALTPECCALLGVDYEAVQPRLRMAAATSSGLSVTT